MFQSAAGIVYTFADTYTSLFSDVWIIGDSYIHWAEQRAATRHVASNLGIPGITSIKWLGIRGMHWDQLMNKIQYLGLHNAAPRAIMLHLGSNDIGSVRCNVLRQVFRRDILALAKMFPTAVLMVSAMLPRMAWSASISRDKVEKKRKLLNRFLRRLISYIGGSFITHEEITTDTPGFYFRDGIHLSDVGCDMFLLSCKDSLENVFGS